MIRILVKNRLRSLVGTILGKSKSEPASFKLDCDDQEPWTIAKEG